MNEALRHEIMQRHQEGTSQRKIAEALGITRSVVARVIAQVRAEREGESKPKELKPTRQRRSKLDAFEPLLKELLEKYPRLTTERALEELQARGFTGKYTILRKRIRLLRPQKPKPVIRFETEPGQQGQMDYGVYDIDFTQEGRRRVYLFSYLLGYSRRQYLHWVESMDLATTLCHHVHAFHYLGGVARVCLYDNFKAVVLRHDAEGVVYNPKFLAFATHYGFRPQACQVRRPQTKGKVEKQMHYVEMNLLNGREFESLEHLNRVTVDWQRTAADVRELRDFGETPLARHQRELPHLLPLPRSDYDTAEVFYRHVHVDGYITHRLNYYSVPWTFIGQILPIRVTENEVVIYTDRLEEITRHPVTPRCQSGVRHLLKAHHPTGDPGERERLLRKRFADFGPNGTAFIEPLLAKNIHGKQQAQHLLAFLAHYSRADIDRAFERAVRFGAFTASAIRRILAAQAKPKPLLAELAEMSREALEPLLRDDPIEARPTSEYQHLLLPKEETDEQIEEKPSLEFPSA